MRQSVINPALKVDLLHCAHGKKRCTPTARNQGCWSQNHSDFEQFALCSINDLFASRINSNEMA